MKSLSKFLFVCISFILGVQALGAKKLVHGTQPEPEGYVTQRLSDIDIRELLGQLAQEDLLNRHGSAADIQARRASIEQVSLNIALREEEHYERLFQALAAHYPKLKALSIHHAFLEDRHKPLQEGLHNKTEGFTTGALQSLVRALPGLETLSLVNCHALSSLKPLAKMHNLRSLTFLNSFLYEEDTFLRLPCNVELSDLKSLKALESLHLDDPRSLKTVLDVAQAFPRLSILKHRPVKGLRHDTIVYYLNNYKNIKHLDVTLSATDAKKNDYKSVHDWAYGHLDSCAIESVGGMEPEDPKYCKTLDDLRGSAPRVFFMNPLPVKASTKLLVHLQHLTSLGTLHWRGGSLKTTLDQLPFLKELLLVVYPESLEQDCQLLDSFDGICLDKLDLTCKLPRSEDFWGEAQGLSALQHLRLSYELRPDEPSDNVCNTGNLVQCVSQLPKLKSLGLNIPKDTDTPFVYNAHLTAPACLDSLKGLTQMESLELCQSLGRSKDPGRIQELFPNLKFLSLTELASFEVINEGATHRCKAQDKNVWKRYASTLSEAPHWALIPLRAEPEFLHLFPSASQMLLNDLNKTGRYLLGFKSRQNEDRTLARDTYMAICILLELCHCGECLGGCLFGWVPAMRPTASAPPPAVEVPDEATSGVGEGAASP